MNNSEVDTFLEKIIFYKKFLEEYDSLDFKSSGILYQYTSKNLTDLILYALIGYEKKWPSKYTKEFGGIEKKWEIQYERQGRKLYAPKTLGQIIKLADILDHYRFSKSPENPYANSIVEPQLEKHSFQQNTYEIDSSQLPYIFLCKNPFDTIQDPKGFIKKIQPWIEFIIFSPDEMPMDYDDRVEFSNAEFLLKKYFGNRLCYANNFKKIKKNWEATVIIASKNDFNTNFAALGKVFSNYNTLGSREFDFIPDNCPNRKLKLCNDQNFIKQPYIGKGYGSGVFFKDNNHILTVAHIFRDKNGNLDINKLVNSYFVKKFEVPIINTNKITYLSKNFFEFDSTRKNEIDWNYLFNDDNGYDWVVIPVKSAFTNQQSTRTAFVSDFRYLPQVEKYNGLQLYWTGHTLGLPKKFFYDGVIKSNDSKKYVFLTDLDILKGNSGTPVFEMENHELVGIVSSDVEDKTGFGFDVHNCECLKLKTRNIMQVEGSKVQRMEILNYLILQ